MHYAIIDLGSNTIRLSIYTYENNKISIVFSQRSLGRLADYIVDEILEKAGIEKACTIVAHWKEVALKFTEPEKIHLFATAALRNIRNQNQAAAEIALKTGLFPHVLSGEEEAKLSFAGASAFVSCESGVLIDIGGASTELVLIENAQPAVLRSFPIGSLSLYTRYIGGYAQPTSSERKQIKKVVREQFDTLDWGNIRRSVLVGVGGTAKTLPQLVQALYDIPLNQGYLSAALLNDIYQQLINNQNNAYDIASKRIPDRVHSLIPGLIIIRHVIERFGCEKMVVSHFGVREGYLLKHVLKVEENTTA